MPIPCHECRHLDGVGFQHPGASDLQLIEKARLAHLGIGRGKSVIMRELGLATLYSGWAIERRRDPAGRMRASRIVLPGSVINLSAAVDRPVDGELHAATDVTLCQFDAKWLDNTRQAPIVSRLLRVALHQLGEAECMLAVLRRLAATGRIAWLIRWIHSELISRRLASGDSFLLPIARSDLADLLNLTPVHLRRSAAALREAGAVRVERDRVTILDPALLDRTAGGPATFQLVTGMRDLL